jgi:uncharacterized protein YbbK (DUF523 family)
MSGDRRAGELRELARSINDPSYPARALELARGMRGATPPVIVSACLLGAKARYDGGDRRTEAVERAVADDAVLPLCPELLAGLGCPRAPVHFARGDGDDLARDPRAAQVLDDAGVDRSAALLEGARRALALAQAAGARAAILKERSPSCGCHEIHTGGGVADGRGVFAALAMRSGITCRSEEDLGPPRSRR